MPPGTLPSFDDVRAELGSTAHVLLGNGFSIGCDPIFRYGSLYDAAVVAGLSERAKAVFGKLGTTNFEAVIRLLADGHWLAQEYGLTGAGLAEIAADASVVRNTLVKAVADSHLAHSGLVSDAKKAAALRFLEPFHNIFTTNYDLLLYWVVMYADDPPWGDGFRSELEDPDAPYVVFSRRLGSEPGLYFLHGALHLYVEAGELRKHCWCRTSVPLIDAIREGLAQERYPMFVAEGSPERKLDQIQRSFYLGYALDKLRRVESTLVVFGHALGPSDDHIVTAIAENLKLNSVFVGLHGDPDSAANQDTRAAVTRLEQRRAGILARLGRASKLSVKFYDSGTASPWA